MSSSKTVKVPAETATSEHASAAATVFSGGGEMGALMRALDWSKTPIGPLSDWPQSLKTAVRIILTSRYAMFVWWGRELVNLYNDPYRAFLGSKHPAALGKSAREVWAEIWDQIGPRTDAVLLRGESTYDEALLLLMERHGYVEETYFTFSYSPLPDENGNVGGLFCAVTEETQQVIRERRLRLLREIAGAIAGAPTPIEVCQSAAGCLSTARRDLPFSLMYLADKDGTSLTRVACAGIDADHPAAPESVTLDGAADTVWPFLRVMQNSETVLIEDLDQRLTDIPKGDWNQASKCAVLLPILQQGSSRPAGVLVAGLNPYRRFEDEFRGFISLLANQIAAAIAIAIAYERERQVREENEERLRLAQSAAQIGTWEWDPVTGASNLSAELHVMFGTSPDQPDHGAQWTARVHPEDWSNVQRLMKEGEFTGEMEFEYRYTHPDLGIRWFYCKGRRAPGETRMFGIVQDITERKRADETLRTALVASQKLAAIVESSDDAIISKDLKGIVTSWNPYAEKLFGYSAEEMIGRSITAIIPPELLSDEDRILSTIARGERIDHFETVRVRKNGERIEVSLTISPVKDDTGKIIGAAKIARDVTQRKKAERALHTSERLASVGRLAATVAHEINNPLEAVTNLIYLAKQDSDQPEVRAYLQAAEEELERISHLTKQTLGFYRETKGVSRMRLGSTVQPLISIFASKTRSKAVEIRPEIKDDPEIHAVPGEIRQLLANLVSNSIDAVDGGGCIRIRVSSATEWNGAKRSGVRLTVADSGPGIPVSQRPKIFEPFFTTKKEVGTGLGLWVCKTIAEKHRGSIRLKSSVIPGRSWTAFSVFLPLHPQHSTVEEPLRQAG